jgi:hypothetical protein
MDGLFGCTGIALTIHFVGQDGEAMADFLEHIVIPALRAGIRSGEGWDTVFA